MSESERKTERPKIYLAVGLAIVLIVVVGFRLVHKKKTHAAAPARSEGGLARLDVPQIQLPDLQRAQWSEPAVNGSGGVIERDIFRPFKARPQKARKGKIRRRAKRPSKPPASLKLKGTIVGGERPIAVINDKFVHTGERIGRYKVVKIEKDGVLLHSGNKRFVLEVLKDD